MKPSRCEDCHISGKGIFQDSSRASQQRDCPGFAPDSLLIRIADRLSETNSGQR
nr:MAG TPA: hypothetical protein [Caudoviricetes sp.]